MPLSTKTSDIVVRPIEMTLNVDAVSYKSPTYS